MAAYRLLALGLLFASSHFAVRADDRADLPPTCSDGDATSLMQTKLQVAQVDQGSSRSAAQPTFDEATMMAAIEEAADEAYHGAAAEEATTNELEATTAAPNYAKSQFGKVSKVKLNAPGDLGAYLSSLRFDLVLTFMMLVGTILMLRWYPNLFAYRATAAFGEDESNKDAPQTWSEDDPQWLRFFNVSWGTTFEEVEKSCGLDQAMLLQFAVLGMDIMLWVGIPLVVIFIPLYAFAGGNAAGEDMLSHAGIANVQYKSWIFWPVAFDVWYNVIIIEWRIMQYQRWFVKQRRNWLERVPKPRNAALLVQGIDDEMCQDKALKDFMIKLFKADAIEDAFVIKKTGALRKILKMYSSEVAKLKDMEYHKEQEPTSVSDTEVQAQREQLTQLEAQVREEQQKVLDEAQLPWDQSTIYSTNGIITFKSRGHRELARHVEIGHDDDKWQFDDAPALNDLLYDELQQPVATRLVFQIIGYLAIVGLFLAFMPIVLGIANATDLTTLEEKYSFVKSIMSSLESYRSTIEGITASLGLTIMMSFLPTFLMWIFDAFFTLVSNAERQIFCQRYYWWFLVVFVLLTTSVGSSLTDTLNQLAHSPFKIFFILADKMPLTTHFYLNYQTFQWVTHFMNLTRYINVTKYFLFKPFMGPSRARAKSEPEDQDYYGIGSRSARFALTMAIGIVFSTACPLLTVVTFFTFGICRTIYGYLIPYAEGRKEDIGGEHWVTQLIHVEIAVGIYIVLMVGMVTRRASSWGPVLVAAISFLYWMGGFYKLRHALKWYALPFDEITEEDKSAATDRYQQPELDPDVCKKILETH